MEDVTSHVRARPARFGALSSREATTMMPCRWLPPASAASAPALPTNNLSPRHSRVSCRHQLHTTEGNTLSAYRGTAPEIDCSPSTASAALMPRPAAPVLAALMSPPFSPGCAFRCLSEACCSASWGPAKEPEHQPLTPHEGRLVVLHIGVIPVQESRHAAKMTILQGSENGWMRGTTTGNRKVQ